MARPKTDNVDIKLRAPTALRTKLEEAARLRGVSVNAEIVDRLKHSTDRDGKVDLLDNSVLRGIARTVVAAMNESGTFAAFASTGIEGSRAWWDDPFAYSQAVRVADLVLQALAPEGEIKSPRMVQADLVSYVGEQFTRTMLAEIRSGEPASSGTIERTRTLREELGHIADRIKEPPKESE